MKAYKVKVYLNPDNDKRGTAIDETRIKQLMEIVGFGIPIGKIKMVKLCNMETGECWGGIYSSIERIVGGWNYRNNYHDNDHMDIEMIEIIHSYTKNGETTKLLEIKAYRREKSNKKLSD